MTKDHREQAPITPEESLASLPQIKFEPGGPGEESGFRRAELLQSVLLIAGMDHATEAQFVRDKVGSFDTELVREWFQAFAVNGGLTLHVTMLYGSNDHHIAESCFKGLARALRAAVAIDARAANEVPSTKGSLGG